MTLPPCALIVDEDPSFRSLARNALEEVGLRVAEAERPGQAFTAFLLAGAFDLLVIDLALPGMSGVQLADALRDPARDQRVLFLSDSPDPPRLGPGRRHLAKPFTPAELLAEVQCLVENR